MISTQILLQLLFIVISLLSYVTNNQSTSKFKLKRSLIHNDIENDRSLTNCSCVPYYQCSEESGRVITDGDGLLDLRGLEDNTCTGYFDVCCNTTISQTTSPAHSSSKTSLITTEVPDKSCGFLKQMLVPWSGILLIQSSSAVSSASASSSLKPPKKYNYNYKCGVSIIHPKLALTAAHCLSTHEPNFNANPSHYKVKVADYITQVIKIIQHPEYNTGTLQNDIALLVLQDELTQVGTICIPPPGSQYLERQCTVTTWKKSGRLRIIEVPLVNHQKCEKLLRKTRLGKYFQLHLSFMCAGGNSFQDACDGDGGSPLICPVAGQPGRYHQVGIVSWGIGCGEKDTPGVYVNVAAFRNWIDEMVLNEISNGNMVLQREGNGIRDGINSYREQKLASVKLLRQIYGNRIKTFFV